MSVEHAGQLKMIDLAQILFFVLTEGKLNKASLKCISTDTTYLYIKK